MRYVPLGKPVMTSALWRKSGIRRRTSPANHRIPHFLDGSAEGKGSKSTAKTLRCHHPNSTSFETGKRTPSAKQTRPAFSQGFTRSPTLALRTKPLLVVDPIRPIFKPTFPAPHLVRALPRPSLRRSIPCDHLLLVRVYIPRHRRRCRLLNLNLLQNSNSPTLSS